MDDYIKQINTGLDSIRQAMAEGFKEANENTAELSELLAVLNERVGHVRSAQGKLEKEISVMKDIKTEVEKNTQFRKDMIKAIWIILGVVITAATLAALAGFAGSYGG